MLFYTKIFKILLRLDRNRLDNEKFLAPINLVLLSKPIVPYTTPVSDKLNRFYTVEPWFKQGIMFFPEELKGDGELMDELLNELALVTKRGFLSKHDDVLDCISMLSAMSPWKPSKEDGVRKVDDPMWEPWEEDDTGSSLGSYVV